MPLNGKAPFSWARPPRSAQAPGDCLAAGSVPRALRVIPGQGGHGGCIHSAISAVPQCVPERRSGDFPGWGPEPRAGRRPSWRSRFAEWNRAFRAAPSEVTLRAGGHVRARKGRWAPRKIGSSGAGGFRCALQTQCMPVIRDASWKSPCKSGEVGSLHPEKWASARWRRKFRDLEDL